MRYHKIQLFGRDFLVDPDDALELTKWGEYEKYESSLILNILGDGKGKTAIDIGAHIGYYATLLASTGATVYAYEPNPFNFVFLDYNAEQYDNLYAMNCAVSDYCGNSEIYLSPVNSGDDTLYPFDTQQRLKVPVSVTKLDNEYALAYIQIVGLDVPKPTIDFAKLDIQGGELRALKGMEHLIDSSPNLKMALEFYPDGIRAAGDDPAEILVFMWGHGFKIWEINPNEHKLEPINSPEFCQREDLRVGYTNLFASKIDL